VSKTLPARKGKGFKPWTEADVEAYYRRWPLGTHERVWLDVLLYSGLRRGDVVRYGRQHVRNGIGKMRLEKGGDQVEVTLPILPVLADTLAVGPCGDLTFIVGKQGKRFTKESFGNAFKDACKAAGIRDKSAHGVRKIAATTAANNGATVSQSRHCSDGRVIQCQRFTPRRPTGSAWRANRPIGWRTRSELLFPHLSARCGRYGQKTNEINAKFFGWCGREDSNLHGSPR
jgi:integrase